MVEIKSSERVATALKRREWPDAQPWDLEEGVAQIVDEVGAGAAISKKEAQNAVGALVDNRYYSHARTIARRWMDTQPFDPRIVRSLAQAEINSGALDTAEKLLNDDLPKVKADTSDANSQKEVAEFEGLLGRIEKQRFVGSGDLNLLVSAHKKYFDAYERTKFKNFWHGINAVALRAREEREGIGDGEASAAMAAKVLDAVTKDYVLNPASAWHPATASEACLAMGDCDGAELWLYRFLNHANVSPFAIESYDRQVREIWQGSPLRGGDSCGDRLATISAGHLARTQRLFLVSPRDVDEARKTLDNQPAGFEKNFMNESTFTVDHVRKLLEACGSVGCVTKASGERVGSGFLLAGSVFGLGPDPVFVTNAHVISEDDETAVRPTDALVTFEVESAAAGKPVHYKIKELLFSSPKGKLGVSNAVDDELDVTVVKLEGLASKAPVLEAAKRLPAISAKTRVYVVGHPNGSGLQIALQDSRLLDVDDYKRLVHYRTPTDPGSSGSPVFNSDWQVVALHHGGSFDMPRLRGAGGYEANEGISLLSIQRKWHPVTAA